MFLFITSVWISTATINIFRKLYMKCILFP